MKISEIRKKNIAILWFGKEGRSTLDFLVRLWVEKITILDKNPIEISEKNIKIISWKDYLDNLWDFNLIFKSPWISPYNPKILAHKKKLISWAEVFFNNYEGRVIWITWTKWKSTTSTLTYKALKAYWYNVKLVWNIGNPVLDEIDILWWEEYDYVVYELSSYMLEEFIPKCFISVLLNIYPDHLDWHENFENYKKAKLNIIKESLSSLININFSEDSKNSKTFWNSWDYHYKWHNFYIDNHKIFDDKNIVLKWEHNKSNISAVIWVLDIIWVKDFLRFESVLENFKWLPHRLETIWKYDKITFIDDAISTTPESTIEAIKTFWDKIWTIFLWGTDRGYNFEELVKYLRKYNIENIVLFPESWKKIKDLLDNSFSILETSSMKDAARFAFKNTNPEEICLLSTASPSYSLWKNFEEKWEEFKKEVEKNSSK